MIRIPTYEECRAVIEQDQEKGSFEATALHRFIHDNEPSGVENELHFRDGLRAVLEEIIGEP